MLVLHYTTLALKEGAGKPSTEIVSNEAGSIIGIGRSNDKSGGRRNGVKSLFLTKTVGGNSLFGSS
jgi:hypothetical protein